MNTTTNTEALHELETNPDLDPDERAELAAVVRARIEELELAAPAPSASPAPPAREMPGRVPAPAPGPKEARQPSVLCWQRGTSFSMRADGPEDAMWFEELAGDVPAVLRVRPEPASRKRLDEDAKRAWATGVRAHVVAFHDPNRVEVKPGDWTLVAPRVRNRGGHVGKSPIVTFSIGQGLILVDDDASEANVDE